MTHRVLLVEDHPITVEGLVALLAREPDLTVAATVTSAPEALDALGAATEAGAPIHLALVDVRLDGGDGIELTKSVKACYPDLPVLVLSTFDESVYAERAVRAGATGYVMKTSGADELLAAVRDALAGRLYLSPSMRDRLLHHYLDGAGAGAASPVALLTDREMEVFTHFGRGLSTAQAAESMMVSPKTVETHRVHIKRKLGVETPNELVRVAALWVAANGG